MFSLSHLAVVAVVVAVMMLAWKLERRKPKGTASASGARPPTLERQLLKAAALIILIAGALTPAFWTDETARYIHIVCTTGLAVLAGLWMFQRGEK